MPLILDPERHAAVAFDHLPRVAAYDDGSQSVLYWNNVVRSMEADRWQATVGPLPADPTPAESAAAHQQLLDAQAQSDADAVALRNKILTTAQTAVGIAYDQLSATQLRALFGILLFKADALDKNGVVRPLSEWVR